MRSCLEANQAYTLSKAIREGRNDIDNWSEPLGPSIIEILGRIWHLDLLVKDGENVGGRVAGLKLGGEGMDKKIFLGACFVGFQRIVDDYLEIG